MIVESGNFKITLAKLWYIIFAFPPGRSHRPHPSIKRVSPAIRASLYLKHWHPGVCPGVCKHSNSILPIFNFSRSATFIKFLQSNPHYFGTYFTLAQYWTDRKNFKKALDYLNQGLQKKIPSGYEHSKMLALKKRLEQEHLSQ